MNVLLSTTTSRCVSLQIAVKRSFVRVNIVESLLKQAGSSGRSVSFFSTTTTESTNNSSPSPTVVTLDDGRQYAVVDKKRNPKLKPSVVRKRIERLKTYEGKEKNIRHSPWRLNLVCQLAAGLPLEEALLQLQFCDKAKAPLVRKVLQRTSNLADIRDGIQPSQLEVAECFATHGTHLKRLKIMGRGR